MAAPKPAHQICPICGYDDDIETVLAAGEWVMTCTFKKHPPFEWRPASQYAKPTSYRTGEGERLGVYDDLLLCVSDGFAEYGVIEYRYWQRSPDTYKLLVDRYGHRATIPSKYTASSFLGGALGHLWREGSIEGMWGPTTGYWSYNDQIGTYAPSGTPEGSDILSWEAFAATRGFNSMDWPPLEYRC